MRQRQNQNYNDLMVSGTMIKGSQPLNRLPQKILIPYQNPKLMKTKQAFKQRVPTQQDIPKQVIQQVQEIPINCTADLEDPKEKQYQISQAPITKLEQAPAVYRSGEVTVLYSHYKDKFPILDGVLLESVVDEQYCLSFVFKGNYTFLLRLQNDTQYLKKQGKSWIGVEDQKIYKLEIDEDPEQLALEALKDARYVAFDPYEVKGKKKSNQVELINQELKNMSMQEIQDKGMKYRELIEARDLEDILYR